MNWRNPVNHLEFVGPGAVLMAVSVFGVAAAMLTVESVGGLIDQLYFKASVVGIVISMLILFRTKLGTALFFTLIIPYGCYVYWFTETHGLSWSVIPTTVMFSFVVISNGRKQIRYHSTQQKSLNKSCETTGDKAAS
jgi:hypothetical protein